MSASFEKKQIELVVRYVEHDPDKRASMSKCIMKDYGKSHVKAATSLLKQQKKECIDFYENIENNIHDVLAKITEKKEKLQGTLDDIFQELNLNTEILQAKKKEMSQQGPVKPEAPKDFDF